MLEERGVGTNYGMLFFLVVSTQTRAYRWEIHLPKTEIAFAQVGRTDGRNQQNGSETNTAA